MSESFPEASVESRLPLAEQNLLHEKLSLPCQKHKLFYLFRAGYFHLDHKTPETHWSRALKGDEYGPGSWDQLLIFFFKWRKYNPNILACDIKKDYISHVCKNTIHVTLLRVPTPQIYLGGHKGICHIWSQTNLLREHLAMSLSSSLGLIPT